MKDDDILDELFPEEAPEEESRPCSDYGNEGYKCVSEDLCDENGEIRTDGGSKFSIRNNFFGSPQSNAICPDQFAVCCKDPNLTTGLLRIYLTQKHQRKNLDHAMIMQMRAIN